MMRISPARRAAIERMSLTLLVIISAVMIIIAKADQVAFQSVRNSVMDAAAPALDMLSRPAAALDAAADRVRGLITVYRENIRLAEENERLLGWQQVAMRLSAENAELRDVAKLVPEPGTSFVTARVIADSGGAYARSVMVNAGRDNGVARGQAAMTAEGLVGRVAEVGNRAARVLLITDLNSRVPVVPPGLPVGVVASVDSEGARVEPYAALSRVDYLRLVDYGLAEALPNPLPISARVGKHAESGVGGPPTLRR
jgi:rod shape-determining protein MreC